MAEHQAINLEHDDARAAVPAGETSGPAGRRRRPSTLKVQQENVDEGAAVSGLNLEARSVERNSDGPVREVRGRRNRGPGNRDGRLPERQQNAGAKGTAPAEPKSGLDETTGVLRSAFRPPRGQQESAAQNGETRPEDQRARGPRGQRRRRGSGRPEAQSGPRPAGEQRPREFQAAPHNDNASDGENGNRRRPDPNQRPPLQQSRGHDGRIDRGNYQPGPSGRREGADSRRGSGQDQGRERSQNPGRQHNPAVRQRSDGSADPRGPSRQDPRQQGRVQGRGPGGPAVRFRPLPGAAAEIAARGVLDVRPDGSGYLRTRDNWLPDPADIAVPSAVIRRLNLRPGQMIVGMASQTGRSSTLSTVQSIEELPPESAAAFPRFTALEAEIPFQRLRLEKAQEDLGPRIIDLLAPIGKGQRGLIVAPPQAGKTRVLKDIASSIARNHPDTALFILLIDERPEEVTELRSLGFGKVIASSFDEGRTGHLAAAELALERMQRMVEAGRDVFLLIDSLTRLARASNLSIRGTGRSMSGGLDPAALTFPRKLFGAARATSEAGSLTILATALVETGSVMDEFVFQEFKGTGNWEVKLDRKLAQRRIFPAFDITTSGTRREEMLYTPQELVAVTKLRQYLWKYSQQPETRAERLIWLLTRTKTNAELLGLVDRL